mmetsp:Transcript_37014/g.93501  ORF Transcript_37014/g.93501 Transcript_37014/m.93501 type:complete len:275 (-) Transcript_37014:189-1013(-)
MDGTRLPVVAMHQGCRGQHAGVHLCRRGGAAHEARLSGQEAGLHQQRRGPPWTHQRAGVLRPDAVLLLLRFQVQNHGCVVQRLENTRVLVLRADGGRLALVAVGRRVPGVPKHHPVCVDHPGGHKRKAHAVHAAVLARVRGADDGHDLQGAQVQHPLPRQAGQQRLSDVGLHARVARQACRLQLLERAVEQVLHALRLLRELLRLQLLLRHLHQQRERQRDKVLVREAPAVVVLHLRHQHVDLRAREVQVLALQALADLAAGEVAVVVLVGDME